jgi:hypothetical protein
VQGEREKGELVAAAEGYAVRGYAEGGHRSVGEEEELA